MTHLMSISSHKEGKVAPDLPIGAILVEQLPRVILQIKNHGNVRIRRLIGVILEAVEVEIITINMEDQGNIQTNITNMINIRENIHTKKKISHSQTLEWLLKLGCWLHNNLLLLNHPTLMIALSQAWQEAPSVESLEKWMDLSQPISTQIVREKMAPNHISAKINSSLIMSKWNSKVSHSMNGKTKNMTGI